MNEQDSDTMTSESRNSSSVLEKKLFETYLIRQVYASITVGTRPDTLGWLCKTLSSVYVT